MKKNCDIQTRRRFFSYLFFIIFTLGLTIQCSEKKDISLPPDEWSFLVFGDIRMGYGVYSILTQSMAGVSPTPKLAICGGDVMNHGSNEVEWSAFWEYSKSITDKMPLYITRGNHEGNTKGDEMIFRQQTKSAIDKFYFTVKEKNAVFIILDTEIKGEVRGIYNEQLAWLKNELTIAQNDNSVDHIFLSLHRPLYPKGGHEGEDLGNANELHDLFLEHNKINVVFVSHDHLFNKYEKDGIAYITSGGAGGPLHRGKGGDYYHYVLVSINEETHNINLKTVGVFNEIVEDFHF